MRARERAKGFNLCLIGYFFILLTLSMTLPAGAANSPKGPDLNAAARKKIPQEVIDKLERGNETVDIIILLKGYEGYVGKIKADKPQEMKKQQGEIRSRQDLVLSRINKPDLTLRHQFDNILGFSATVNAKALKALAAMPDVELIEEDLEVEAHLAQGIPLMEGSQVRSVYDGSGVAIAIVDTGINYQHSMLGASAFPNTKVIGGFDFGDNDPNPMDCQGHGTSVAGIAAGNLASGPGDYIGGVAPNAKLYALKIVSGCGTTAFTSTIANAWNWAVTHKYDDPANPILVVNTSFGGGYYTSACDSSQTALAIAANNAVANGITLFSSSGNDGYTNGMGTPACVSNSLSVGAVYDADIGYRYWNWVPCTDYTTAPDQVICYSNSANFLDLLAPSHNAYTTSVGGGYTNFGGTSAASPYTAGAGALLQSYAKSELGHFLNPSDLRAQLINAGDPVIDGKNNITKPRVNILAAIGADWIAWWSGPFTNYLYRTDFPTERPIRVRVYYHDDEIWDTDIAGSIHFDGGENWEFFVSNNTLSYWDDDWEFNRIDVFYVQSPPTITVPDSSTENYTISWAASPTSGVTYRLEEATNSTFTTGLRTVVSGTSSLNASISGRSQGVTYYYRVRAEKSGLHSPWVNGANGCTVWTTWWSGSYTDYLYRTDFPTIRPISIKVFYHTGEIWETTIPTADYADGDIGWQLTVWSNRFLHNCWEEDDVPRYEFNRIDVMY